MGSAVIALAIAGCETPVVDLAEPPVTVATETAGNGPEARVGRLVSIDYVIRLPDGTEVLRDQDYQFKLGEGAVIAGVDRAVEGMRVGGRRTVECPPHMHWGRQGHGDKIPPNTNLSIDIRLNRVR